ncbi:uncharacterized protein LOC128350487 [Hemicordylus capensis]|uniref:uncharacterized protein LOC128350487 n=1 Tax=Hemicordylus capensis TaxID=884348 RepID=UPI0023034C77|nr:uncharacterized protein LOC128350487 [Hemicordylus capensis]
MSNMDFSSSFLLPCMLVILTIIDGRASAGRVQVTRNIGSEIAFPLGIRNQSNISTIVMRVKNCSCTMNSTVDCCNCFNKMCLKNGSPEMKDLSKNDEGEYYFSHGTTSKTFFLRICEMPPNIRVHCLPDGKAELSCEVGNSPRGSIYWTLNGNRLNGTDACEKDGGTTVVLEKGVTGALVCHRGNACSISTQLVCHDVDLLKHPLFLVLLAACGGAAILLVIIASVITCCCMKRKHNFIPVPAEDEKDEGVTLSVMSTERQKSPPNGDRCETTAALADRTASPGPENLNPEPKMDLKSTTEPVLEPGPKTEVEAEKETEFREVMVDSTALEATDDCFPDPIEA